MSAQVIHIDKATRARAGNKYAPALVVVNKKMYKTRTWNELFKIAMFSFCYSTDRISVLNRYVDINTTTVFGRNCLISTKSEEGQGYVKFSPDHYVKVFAAGNNVTLLRMMNQEWCSEFEAYIIESGSKEELNFDLIVSERMRELQEDKRYKTGSTKHLIAYINSKILSPYEKFIRRIEREFDRTVLIGDIEVSEEEEEYLRSYMHFAISSELSSGLPLYHEKVFAFGMVRVALKYYASKTFWPYVNKEYNVKTTGNTQKAINAMFRKIMLRHGKLFYDESNDYVQNMCMHAFVCDRCADQFFDYVFDFWRVDLSRSVENFVDDEGNDVFGILIDEINRNSGVSAQGIMYHTTLALQMNPRGCRNRVRRVLKLIDRCYWDNADYSESTNRMTVLFNKWKSNNNGLFARDIKKTAEGRSRGRGEKSLSRPAINYIPMSGKFTITLPRQILRECTEEEHPVWTVTTNERILARVEPQLIQGKASLFTSECHIDIDEKDVFNRIDFFLQSEVQEYYRRQIPKEDVRFMNKRFKDMPITFDYVPKDACYAVVRKDKKLRLLNTEFTDIQKSGEFYDFYTFENDDSDVFILPNGHALSIGKPLSEGIVGGTRKAGVSAEFDDVKFDVFSGRGKLFFKAPKARLNGSSITVEKHGKKYYFGRVTDSDYIEFRLEESINDVYGYFLDMHDFIREDDVYRIQLDIPGFQNRIYNICYIKDFDFSFENAPYLFQDSGTIVFPSFLNVKTDSDWEISTKTKSLTFGFDETDKRTDFYLTNGNVKLQYAFREGTIDLMIGAPILYWKFDINDEWAFKAPDLITSKALPNNIYISGNLTLQSALLIVAENLDMEDFDAKTNIDTKTGMYYFRTVDIKNSLNRKKEIRTLEISVDGKIETFMEIACRSVVESYNISGIFSKGLIFGNFDIFGDSDYMVSVYYGQMLIEDNVAVRNGEFQIECDVREGLYQVVLYEIEDDDSGFDSISYEIGRYELELTDTSRLAGKSFLIKSIKDRSGKYAQLRLRHRYAVKDLVPLDFMDDVDGKIDVYSWLYDFGDTASVAGFSYYWGMLVEFPLYQKTSRYEKLGKVLVIFNDSQKSNEILVNSIEDEYTNSLIYNPSTYVIYAEESQVSRKMRRSVLSLDDDRYEIDIDFDLNGYEL